MDEDVPKREVIPHLDIVSRQEARANARRGAKEAKKNKSLEPIFDEPTPNAKAKRTYGFYSPGSLPDVMARMDKVEKDLGRLYDGHKKLLYGNKATEEKLLGELAALRESLTANRPSEATPAPREAAPQPAADDTHEEAWSIEDIDVPASDETPELAWSEEEFDIPARETAPTKTNRPKKKAEKPAPLEGQALLESLADKYGIILSPGARAERLRALNKTLEGFAPQLAEEARLNQLLADDEETLRTTEDITASNEESLKGRIKDTKKKLASISKEVGDARDERDTLVEYPTVAEEVEFNMAETINEIARTNPKNAIRLRQLHNTFADLEQMKSLLRPEAENLAERYGIIIDPTQREARLTRLQKDVRKRQEEFNKVDDEIISLQKKQEEANIFKVRDRLGEEIKKLEEKREKIRNQYNEAGDRYSAALTSSPEKEIEASIQKLREDRNNGFNHPAVVDERIAGLERLKSLLPPPLSEKETQPQDLGLDYAHEPNQEEEPASAEVDLDEENLADVVEPEEATFEWTPSNQRKLEEEEAKFRAPREARDLPPRVLPGQTRDSLAGRIDQIDRMIETGRAMDGTIMSNPRQQQLKRGRAVLARRLETMKPASVEEEGNNRRISGTRETYLPFPTSGSSDPEILEQDRLIAEHEVVKTEQAQTRERNAQTYRARAQEYKKELVTIANALAERGEFVEVPGQVPLTTEPEKKPWYSSAWTKLKEATVRRDVAALKKQYEVALERYEEANQLKNAVERNTPVYERVNITGGLKGYAEKPGQVEQRRAELVVFEDRLQHLTKTERLAQDTMDSLVLNQRMDGAILEKKEKRKAADKIGEALSKQRTDDEEYNKLTRARRNNIPIIQLQKLAAGEEFNQYFEFDKETLEGIQAIQRSTERTLKALEAKVTLAKTKMERDIARKRLNELKKLLGGKDAEEMANRAVFLVRAAQRVGLMEIKDPSLHQDLASRYGTRINELRTWLEPKGREAELLTDLEKELNQVTQEANKKF